MCILRTFVIDQRVISAINVHVRVFSFPYVDEESVTSDDVEEKALRDLSDSTSLSSSDESTCTLGSGLEQEVEAARKAVAFHECLVFGTPISENGCTST